MLDRVVIVIPVDHGHIGHRDRRQGVETRLADELEPIVLGGEVTS